jgi:hypothetical protein
LGFPQGDFLAKTAISKEQQKRLAASAVFSFSHIFGLITAFLLTLLCKCGKLYV